MKDFVDDSKAFCLSSLTCSSVISLRLLHSEGDPDSILSSPVDCQSPVDLLTCHLGFFCKSFGVLFFISSCKGLDLYLFPCSEAAALSFSFNDLEPKSFFFCCLLSSASFRTTADMHPGFGSLLTAYHRFG